MTRVITVAAAQRFALAADRSRSTKVQLVPDPV